MLQDSLLYGLIVMDRGIFNHLRACLQRKKRRKKTAKSKLNVVFVLVPMNICSYNNLYCATVLFSGSSLSASLSLSGANFQVSLCMRVATVQPQSASCGLASAKLTGWPHERTASFRNSTHCTVWTKQLLSAKDKQTDRELRQRERGEKNMGGMKRCEGAREQSRTCEKCSNVFFLFFTIALH